MLSLLEYTLYVYLHTYTNILPPFGDTVVNWLSSDLNAVILKKKSQSIN